MGISEALVTGLLLWIANNSAFDMPPDRPEIHLEYPKFVDNMLGYGHTNSLTGLAFYDDHSNRIYVSDKVNINTTEGRSVIVHDLVHWLQDNHPAYEYDCKNEQELRAYYIQDEYVKTHGGDPNFVNWTWVIGTFRCETVPRVPSHDPAFDKLGR